MFNARISTAQITIYTEKKHTQQQQPLHYLNKLATAYISF